MAHRLTGTHGSTRVTAPIDDDDAGDETLGRRTYLRLAAAAVALLVSAGRTAAATATGSEPGDPGRWLVIRGGDGVSSYELTVAGSLTPGADGEDARISGTSVEGVVREEDRSYRIEGEIRDLVVDGDAEVRVGTDPLG